jgi:hypothetical protein
LLLNTWTGLRNWHCLYKLSPIGLKDRLTAYTNLNIFINDWFVIPPLPGGGGGYTVLPLSICPSVQDIFRHIFLSNYRWQKSDIWSQASYRYAILWVAFLDPSDSYFLFADLVGFYTHWTYMHIFRHIFLSNQAHSSLYANMQLRAHRRAENKNIEQKI